jgi:DNA-binding MarR family transcriptional regulator
MGFDALVANAGRLSILTALAVEQQQEFVELRRRTELTDGNLACHARRLATAGLIDIEKSFRNGKPVTRLSLTVAGRAALEAHARRVLAAISHRRITLTPPGDVSGILPIDAPPPSHDNSPSPPADAPSGD